CSVSTQSELRALHQAAVEAIKNRVKKGVCQGLSNFLLPLTIEVAAVEEECADFAADLMAELISDSGCEPFIDWEEEEEETPVPSASPSSTPIVQSTPTPFQSQTPQEESSGTPSPTPTPTFSPMETGSSSWTPSPTPYP